MKHASLFSGIGGFDLAAEWMGWENIFHCEQNPFCQTVLKHHFPDSICHGDITKTDFIPYANKIDILTGGFPCQPFSVAGKQLGTKDERHLWPEMLRAIREIKPRFVVGENVGGLISWNGGLVFEQVHIDLETEGYEVQSFILPAVGVNAPHRRNRVWIVGYSKHNGYVATQKRRNDNKPSIKAGTDKIGEFEGTNSIQSSIIADSGSVGRERRRGKKSKGWENDGTKICLFCTIKGFSTFRTTPHSESKRIAELRIGEKQEYTEYGSIGANGAFADSDGGRQPCKKYGQTQSRRFTEKSIPSDWQNFPTQSPLCNGNDGISSELDGITFSKWRNESIKAGGNAIVPQVVYQIFKAIQKNDRLPNTTRI